MASSSKTPLDLSPPPETSRALGYEAIDPLATPDREMTTPLQPAVGESAPRAPILAIFGAGMLLISLAFLVVLFSTHDAQSQPFQPQTLNQTCEIYGDHPMNVRAGPGFDYERVWILAAEERRQVLLQIQDGADEWLQIQNGWLLRREVRLNSLTNCNQVPVATRPMVFGDDIELPKAVLDLEWREILGENFATDVNGWIETSPAKTAILRDGALILFAQPELEAEVYPSLSPNYYPLGDAYYTLTGRWIASDVEAELVLVMRESTQGAYQLGVRRDGILAVRWLPPKELPIVLEERIESSLLAETFTVGWLHKGTQLEVFVNGESILQLRHDAPAEGGFWLSLQGENSSLAIERFEVVAPAEAH